MGRKLAFHAKDVIGFTPAGSEGVFVSRMLVDEESVGSQQMVANLFALKPGQTSGPGTHPEPYDELYFVVRGRALLRLGDPPDLYEVSPGWVAFIPAGTAHGLENIGDEDFEVLTVVPRPLVEGANGIYDARRKAWGKTFKLVGQE